MNDLFWASFCGIVFILSLAVIYAFYSTSKDKKNK
jgi:hypothetical protein